VHRTAGKEQGQDPGIGVAGLILLPTSTICGV